MARVGVVVIGHNEAGRLPRCLASGTHKGMPVVYVDSASTDGSTDVARSLGVEVLELEVSTPVSAARARNEGFARLMRIASDVQFVQFLDGDCEIVAGWIERAQRELAARPDAAVVCGRRRERFPEASIYNRLADQEWNTPIGEVSSCGGDAMMRVEAFRSAGGFDASAIAGEEPELCQRLRENGYKILRIDADMTLHDAAMLHFGQWWMRTERSGYGAMDIATRFGHRGLFVRHVQSARLWAIGWPAAVVTSLVIGTFAANSAAAAIAAQVMVILLLPLQMIRVALGIRKRHSAWGTAIAYGIFTMIGKWANLAGQFKYVRDQAAGRHARFFELKS